MKKLYKLAGAFLALALLAGCAQLIPESGSDIIAPALSNANDTAVAADSTAPAADDAFYAAEPPLSEQDRTVPVPDFLTQEQKELYWKAYRLFYLFRVCPDYIDNMTLYPYEPVDYGYDYFNTIELDGYEYHPAIGRYHDWETFDGMVHGVFTDAFTQSLYNGSGYPSFREIDGVTYYVSYERGTDPAYDSEMNPASFEKITADETQIEFAVTAEYRGFHWDEARQDLVENDPTYKTYSVRFERTDSGWRIARACYKTDTT